MAKREVPEVTTAHMEAAARVRDYYTDQSLHSRIALAIAYAEQRGRRQAESAKAEAQPTRAKAAESALTAMTTRAEMEAPACRACGSELTPECAWVADGCPCNSPRGVNHGLVPRRTCTCEQCDPEQTGSTRAPEEGSINV